MRLTILFSGGLKNLPCTDTCLQNKLLCFRKMKFSYKVCFSHWRKITQCMTLKILVKNMQKLNPLKIDLFLLVKIHFLFHLTDYSFKCLFAKHNSFEIIFYLHSYCHCPNPCSYYLKFIIGMSSNRDPYLLLHSLLKSILYTFLLAKIFMER